MNHSQLHAIDLAIIGAYLIAMIVMGVVVVKKIKNTDDYYLGGRSFGPLVLMATVCATIIGGSGLMGRAGVAYSSGFKAIMTAVPYLLGMLILFVYILIPGMSLVKLAGLPFGLGATVPGAIACAAALVIVSLATYKKSPSPFLDPYTAKT